MYLQGRLCSLPGAFSPGDYQLTLECRWTRARGRKTVRGWWVCLCFCHSSKPGLYPEFVPWSQASANWHCWFLPHSCNGAEKHLPKGGKRPPSESFLFSRPSFYGLLGSQSLLTPQLKQLLFLQEFQIVYVKYN